MKLYAVEGSEPTCPECKNRNAMLYNSNQSYKLWVKEGQPAEDRTEVRECRDCGFTVNVKPSDIIITPLS